MIGLLAKILFATDYFTLSLIYHVPGMIYHVLSEPCVYISSDNKNQQDRVQQTTLVHMYLTPAVHSPAIVLVPPASLHTTDPVVVEWRGKDKPGFDNASLIDSDPFQISCCFLVNVTFWLEEVVNTPVYNKHAYLI